MHCNRNSVFSQESTAMTDISCRFYRFINNSWHTQQLQRENSTKETETKTYGTKKLYLSIVLWKKLKLYNIWIQSSLEFHGQLMNVIAPHTGLVCTWWNNLVSTWYPWIPICHTMIIKLNTKTPSEFSLHIFKKGDVSNIMGRSHCIISLMWASFNREQKEITSLITNLKASVRQSSETDTSHRHTFRYMYVSWLFSDEVGLYEIGSPALQILFMGSFCNQKLCITPNLQINAGCISNY